MTMTQGSPPQTIPLRGTHYYAIVDAQKQHTPLAVIASVYEPDVAWQQYRFDKGRKKWIEDAKLVAFFVGGETDALRARTLTDDQAATILEGWGGKVATFADTGEGHWVTIDGHPVMIGGADTGDKGSKGGGGGSGTVRDRGAPISGHPPAGIQQTPEKALAYLRQHPNSSNSMTRNQMENMTSQAIPSAPIVSLIDLNPSAIQPQMVALAEVAQDYPAAGKALAYVGVYDGVGQPTSQRGEPIGWVPSAYAQAADGTPEDWVGRVGAGAHQVDMVAFNPKFFGVGSYGPDPMGAEMQRNVDAGWFPKEATQPGWVAVHEFGHVVQADMEKTGGTPQVGTWFANHPPNASLSLYGAQAGDAYSENGRVLQETTTGQDHERFAESFAAYYMGSDHPYAKSMGTMLSHFYGSAPRRNTLS